VYGGQTFLAALAPALTGKEESYAHHDAKHEAVRSDGRGADGIRSSSLVEGADLLLTTTRNEVGIELDDLTVAEVDVRPTAEQDDDGLLIAKKSNDGHRTRQMLN